MSAEPMPSVAEATRLRPLIGDHVAARLRARGIETVGDLLRWVPRRYVSYESDLSAAREGEHLVAVADVTRVEVFPRDRRRKAVGKNAIMRVTISDGHTSMPVTFFGTYGRERTLLPGVRAVWTGKVTTFNGRPQLTSPDVEIVADDRGADEPGLLPLYTQVERLRNSSVIIAVQVVLDQIEDLPDPVPAEVRRRHSLVSRLEAFRMLHRPRSHAEVTAARERMRFEEAFVLQVALARRRAEQATDRTLARRPVADGILTAFDARLPFRLTRGQEEVAERLAAEMAAETPMHRLLQGEVGSGKTVVALRAMLAAVDAGGQAALLAPTEVLAQQHYRSMRAIMGDLADSGMLSFEDGVAAPAVATRVVLLTGSLGTADRRRVLSDIATGQAGIVVGTHALIQEGVEFHDLALVVVDEQHRFGVEQRDALRAKGQHPPHVLVMTATPIPRTVAMTVFGDLEVSTLRELPAGRVPITTHVVEAWKPTWVERTWARLAEEVHAGRQAYVVCPRIGDPDERPEDQETGRGGTGGTVDDSDGSAPEVDEEQPTAAASVYAVHALLVEHPVLAGVRTAMLHGRMAPEDKDRTMRAFAAGELDVLVATTVIEVGVDVANATVMVIMDADRYGISQLHQLRGRVGRGGQPGLCLLMTATEAERALERLRSVAATTDGFELARLDLRQRREGDIAGAAQSGRSSLRYLGVIDDEDVIVAAREDAVGVVGADPGLAEHPALAAAVQRLVDEDKAPFLERG